MNLNTTKKILRHSITIDEITRWNYQLIYTSWNKNSKNKESDQNISFPELLKKEINLLDNSQKKSLTKQLSKQTFAINFKNIPKNSPIKKLKQVNLSKKMISNTDVLLFKKKEDLFAYLKKQKNLQKISFWFIQLKQFFFLIPKNNINSWYINRINIHNAITTINVSQIGLFYINIKLKKTTNLLNNEILVK